MAPRNKAKKNQADKNMETIETIARPERRNSKQESSSELRSRKHSKNNSNQESSSELKCSRQSRGNKNQESSSEPRASKTRRTKSK